ncbi:MAG: N-acetylgalactosamine 6-sulfatase (GALNS) [Bryobacterales bacterium]|nr:N-acetylgalactosamine 6-sulfatase (GALNS) [Bryobacterales bacterium]
MKSRPSPVIHGRLPDGSPQHRIRGDLYYWGDHIPSAGSRPTTDVGRRPPTEGNDMRANLSRRAMIRTFGGCAAVGAKAAFGASRDKPNVVVIVSDDHGYADVSAFDHPSEKTPNIDRIGQRGVRFTQGYVSAYVCAPTRAALMTGRYQQRFGFFTASDSRAGMPLSETTIADLLKKHGYATGALGKWHLGLDMEHHPLRRGFDEFYGFLGHGGHDYFNLAPTERKYDSIWRNDKVIEDTGYLTDNLAREAVSFISRHERRPFFLYLAFNAVHFPLQAPEATIKKYDTGNPKRNTLLAMLEHEDRAVGRVLDELKTRGLDQNTLVVFFSDNGGAKNNAANNGALRDFKHSVYEGGIRVPFLMSWPAKLRENTVFRHPVICMDVLPTVAAAAGASLLKDREYHGKNLLPYLTGAASGPVHEWLFWDGDEKKLAVRNGRWKLVSNNARVELFDLEADMREKTDLSVKHPDAVERLQSALDNWRRGNAPRIRSTGGGADEDEEEGGARRPRAERKKGQAQRGKR